SASTPAALFGHQIHALAGLLDTIAPSGWGASTAAGWTVHELVAHLLAGASYINWQLGLVGADPGGGELVWLPRSEVVIAGQRKNEPARTVDEWRAQADLLHGHLAGAVRDDLLVPIQWFGHDTPLRVVAVIHAFETWVHAEDIRRATGRAPEAPTPADLESMSRLAARLLGSAMSASPTAGGRTARGHRRPGRRARGRRRPGRPARGQRGPGRPARGQRRPEDSATWPSFSGLG